MEKELKETRAAYINRLGAILMTYYPEYKLMRYPDGITLKRDYYNLVRFKFDADNDLTFQEPKEGWLFRKMKDSEWNDEVSIKISKLFYEDTDYTAQETAFKKKYRYQRLFAYKWMRRLKDTIIIMLVVLGWTVIDYGHLYGIAEREYEEIPNVETFRHSEIVDGEVTEGEEYVLVRDNESYSGYKEVSLNEYVSNVTDAYESAKTIRNIVIASGIVVLLMIVVYNLRRKVKDD